MKNKKYIDAPTTEQKELIEKGERLSDLNGSVFRRALDEDIEEMGEYDSTATIDRPAKSKKNIRRNFYFAVGLFVSLMSLIGIIFTVNWVIGIVKNIADNTNQKEMFEEYILPIVVCDVPVFDGTHTLANDVILSAAAWDIILYDSDKYADEYGYIKVPSIDLEAHATKLFGRDLDITHQTLGDAVLSFPYDEQTKTYTLPLEPYFMSYTATVSEIKRVGESYTLTVNYYPLISSWMPNNKDKKPDKIMEYTVTGRGDSYSVVKIKELEINHFQ